MVTITHAKVVSTPDDGTSDVGSDEWNAAHVVTGVREQLVADRTYYVRTDGSDSNNGLTNTAGGAFRTIQHACDTASHTLDFGIYQVTIKVADGTYDEYVIINPFIATRGFANFDQSPLAIIGNQADPSLCIIRPTASVAPALAAALVNYQGPGTCYFSGFYVDGGSQTGVSNLFFNGQASIFYIGDCHLGTPLSPAGGNFFIGGPFSFTVLVPLTEQRWKPAANIGGFFNLSENANMQMWPIGAFNITTSFAMTCGFTLTENSTVTLDPAWGGALFGGAGVVTGKKFDLTNGSALYTTSFGTTVTLPGNAVGTMEANCKYDNMVFVVGDLPAASGCLGLSAFVTDSNATLAAGIGNIVATGGSNKVPVYSDGTNWRIG